MENIWCDVDAWERITETEAWQRLNAKTTTRVAVACGMEGKSGWVWSWTMYTATPDGAYTVDSGSGWYGPR